MVALILGHGENLWWILGLGNLAIAMIGVAILVVLVKALQRPARPGGTGLVRRAFIVVGILAALGAVGYAVSMLSAIVYLGLVRE